jgi:hypothetical protein
VIRILAAERGIEGALRLLRPRHWEVLAATRWHGSIEALPSGGERRRIVLGAVWPGNCSVQGRNHDD